MVWNFTISTFFYSLRKLVGFILNIGIGLRIFGNQRPNFLGNTIGSHGWSSI